MKIYDFDRDSGQAICTININLTPEKSKSHNICHKNKKNKAEQGDKQN